MYLLQLVVDWDGISLRDIEIKIAEVKQAIITLSTYGLIYNINKKKFKKFI